MANETKFRFTMQRVIWLPMCLMDQALQCNDKRLLFICAGRKLNNFPFPWQKSGIVSEYSGRTIAREKLTMAHYTRKQNYLSLDLSLEETPSQLNSMKESSILNRTLSYRNLPIAQTVIETAGLWNFHTIDDCLLLLNSHICSRTTEDNHEAIICVAWMPMKRTFLLLHPLVTSTFRLSTLLPSRSAENQFWVFSLHLIPIQCTR